MSLDLGTTQQEAALIVGFFLPLVLAIPIQSHWPSSLKTAFSVAAYAGAGAITAAAAGTLTGKTFWQSTLLILALGVVGYQGVWKPSGIAPAIETHTNAVLQKSEPPSRSNLEPQVISLLAACERLLDQATQRITGPAQVAAADTSPGMIPRGAGALNGPGRVTDVPAPVSERGPDPPDQLLREAEEQPSADARVIEQTGPPGGTPSGDSRSGPNWVSPGPQ
jgi:hypothetical protein